MKVSAGHTHTHTHTHKHFLPLLGRQFSSAIGLMNPCLSVLRLRPWTKKTGSETEKEEK